MFCIAAFIVFAILGIFSASYRDLAKKAWHCVLRRVTLRPCDIDCSEEVKGKLIGKLVFRAPRLARFLSRWIDWLAFLFVILSIWSLLYVLDAGLNLWVYDTCNPINVESCSLSGEACGVNQFSITFTDAVSEGKLGEWVAQPFVRFGQTVSRIPDRMKTWKPEEYLPPTASYYAPFDSSKPTALEVIDPSCKYCRELYQHIIAADFEHTHNLAYMLYPIPDRTKPGGYKFARSPLMASYIEAAKTLKPAHPVSATPADWQLLEKIFTGEGSGADLQTQFVMQFTQRQAEETLHELLLQIGYTEDQAAVVAQRAGSPDIQQKLAAQKTIVEDRLRTIKIPTILFNGRRYDRVVSVDTLR